MNPMNRAAAFALLCSCALLAACNTHTVMPPTSPQGANAKPSLAAPPANVMTPQGY
ncbi:MAG: hypothetical protein INR65_09350 [Gluconacetobacter diazotrophicus]|nr:hypothetical protein [Gluconacetobacter diazotrophicus]